MLIAEGQEPVATEQLRKVFKGKIIAAGGFEPDTAGAIVEKGNADLVAFGRHFIANPGCASKNKTLVLDAFDTLFNKRDYAAAARYWSPDYIQHSAHIKPGRDGLFDLVKSLPPALKYEPGLIAGEGDLVIIHGRFSGFGAPVNWIAADILRVKDGILVEHWDVIQDEATREQSNSGNPMFGDKFPVYAHE